MYLGGNTDPIKFQPEERDQEHGVPTRYLTANLKGVEVKGCKYTGFVAHPCSGGYAWDKIRNLYFFGGNLLHTYMFQFQETE